MKHPQTILAASAASEHRARSLGNPARRWLHTNARLLLNAGSLIGTTGVTSALGFVFWWLAARRFSPEAIGLASAIIAATQLLGTISVCGMGTLLMGEIPRRPGAAAGLISAVVLTVGALAGLGGAIFAATIPWLSRDLEIIGRTPLLFGLFVLGAMATTISLVTDQALIGLLRGGLQLWRNTLFALGKLTFLVGLAIFFSYSSGLSIYGVHVVALWLSLASLIRFVPRRTWSRLLPCWADLRGLRGEAIGHHLLNLTMQAPGLVLPIMITVLYSSELNGSFYIAWLLGSFIFTVPIALATVLYSIGSGSPDLLAKKIQQTLIISFCIIGVANLVSLFGAEGILGLFGNHYATHAAWCFRILVLGALPLVVRTYYLIIQRMQRRLYRTSFLTAIGACLEVGLPVLGVPFGGLTGLAIGWTAAVSVQAIVMTPTVLNAARGLLLFAPAPKIRVGSLAD